MSTLRTLAERMVAGPDSAFVLFGALGAGLAALAGPPLAASVGEAPRVCVLLLVLGVATIVGFGHVSRRVLGPGGLAFYRHALAFLLVAAVVLWLLAWPVLPGLDVAVVMTAIFLGVGRLGCFSAGCCHGRPHPRGVPYPPRRTRTGLRPHLVGLPLLPVQIIEAVLVLVTAGVCAAILVSGAPAGTTLASWGVLYALVRFSTEELRGDSGRPYRAGLSEAQWTSGGILVGVIALEVGGMLPSTGWHLGAGLVGAACALAWLLRVRGSREWLAPAHLNELARVAARWKSVPSGRAGGSATRCRGPVHTGRGLLVSWETTSPVGDAPSLLAFSSAHGALGAGPARRLATPLRALFRLDEARFFEGREAVFFLVSGRSAPAPIPFTDDGSHGI